MKTLLFVAVVVFFTSCGSNTDADSASDSTSATTDTSFNSTMMTDSTGVGGMNTDSSSMMAPAP